MLAADRTFKVIATSELDDGCMGSPAVAGDMLILCTKKALYGLWSRSTGLFESIEVILCLTQNTNSCHQLKYLS